MSSLGVARSMHAQSGMRAGAVGAAEMFGGFAWGTGAPARIPSYRCSGRSGKAYAGCYLRDLDESK